jgi:glycosyltransferase involved in cell wall biosynthesis
MAQLDTPVNGRNAELARAEARISDLEPRLAAFQKRARERAVQLAEQTLELERHNVELGLRLAELDLTEQKLDLAEQRLSKLQRSRSWRVTAPLRYVSSQRAVKLVLRALEVPHLTDRLQLSARLHRKQQTDWRTPDLDLDVPRVYAALSDSGLFDADFYLASNPDVFKRGLDPLAHFIAAGAAELRDPNPLFDTAFYLRENPDAARAGNNPLYHYLTLGASEGRNPNPFFDTKLYAEEVIPSSGRSLNPLAHMLSEQATEQQLRRVLHQPDGSIQWTEYCRQLVQSILCYTPKRKWQSARDVVQLVRPGVAFVVDGLIDGDSDLALALLEELVTRQTVMPYVLLENEGPFADRCRALAPTVVLRSTFAAEGIGSGPAVNDLVEALERCGVRAAICGSALKGDVAQLLAARGFSVVSVIDNPSSEAPSGEPRSFRVRGRAVAPTNPFLYERGYARLQLDKRLGVPERSPLIIGAGLSSDQQGFDLFVDTARLVTQWNPERGTHFIWISNDNCPAGTDLGALHDAPLEHRLHVARSSRDTDVCFAGADILLYLARDGGLSRWALRAGEAALAIVACETAGGVNETVGDNGCVRVPYADVPEMAAAVIALLDDPERRMLVGKTGHDTVAERCDIHEYADFLLELTGIRDDNHLQTFEKCAITRGSLTASMGCGLPRREGVVDSASSTSGAPLVSVVIPSYNHRSFIGEAIASVENQTYPNLELIVVDDGSTDGSLSHVEGLLRDSRFARVLLRSQSNQGATATIDRGVMLSSGDYVAILNSDDVFAPERIQRLVESAAGAADSFVFTGVGFQCSDSALCGEIQDWYLRALRLAARCPTAGFCLLAVNLAVSTSNFFFSRNLFERLRGFDNELLLAHDLDFALRAVHYVEPQFLPEELLTYRYYRSNSVHSLRDRSQWEGLTILAKYLDLGAEGSVNRLAPCTRNWPEFFGVFCAETRPWFSAEPLERLLGLLLNGSSEVRGRGTAKAVSKLETLALRRFADGVAGGESVATTELSPLRLSLAEQWTEAVAMASTGERRAAYAVGS